MHVMYPSDRLFLAQISLEPILHMDAANHQHPVLGFDFSADPGGQPAIRSIDLTRLQRASEGTG